MPIKSGCCICLKRAECRLDIVGLCSSHQKVQDKEITSTLRANVPVRRTKQFQMMSRLPSVRNSSVCCVCDVIDSRTNRMLAAASKRRNSKTILSPSNVEHCKRRIFLKGSSDIASLFQIIFGILVLCPSGTKWKILQTSHNHQELFSLDLPDMKKP